MKDQSFKPEERPETLQTVSINSRDVLQLSQTSAMYDGEGPHPNMPTDWTPLETVATQPIQPDDEVKTDEATEHSKTNYAEIKQRILELQSLIKKIEEEQTSLGNKISRIQEQMEPVSESDFRTLQALQASIDVVNEQAATLDDQWIDANLEMESLVSKVD
jgi:predicted  nucleic acid-binding Zn-ribbon protein